MCGIAQFLARLARGLRWHFVVMTDVSDDLPLAAEFPAATREQWRKLVDGVLKGAPFEERWSQRTADGLAHRAALRPRARRAPGRRRAPAGAPGRCCSASIIPIRPPPTRRRCTTWRTARTGSCSSARARSARTATGSTPSAGHGRARARRRSARCRHRHRIRPQPADQGFAARARRAGHEARGIAPEAVEYPLRASIRSARPRWRRLPQSRGTELGTLAASSPPISRRRLQALDRGRRRPHRARRRRQRGAGTRLRAGGRGRLSARASKPTALRSTTRAA